MIQAISIYNSYIDESLYLDIRKPEDTGFLVTSVTGLEYPKSSISSQSYVTHDGSHIGNILVSSRNIVVTLLFYQWPKEDLSIEDIRWKFNRFFLPKIPLDFYVYNEHGTFMIKGYIESVECNIFSKAERAQVSIICPDPYFMAVGKNGNINIGTVEPLFHFPLSIEGGPLGPLNHEIVENNLGGYDFITRHVVFEEHDNSGTNEYTVNENAFTNSYNGIELSVTHNASTLEFGRIKQYPSTIIEYDGSALTGLTFTIEAKGPVSDLRINNSTRGEYIAIDDTKLKSIVVYGIQKYDTIIINTRKGEKSATLIRDAVNYNILDACIPVKKWPQLQTGKNVFTYSSTSEIQNVRIDASYETKYLGI